jgi:tRNA nucleotidyltransferase (CCA-adding enzyme)
MDFFKQLSGRRIFSELRQILEEENPSAAIVRLNDYDLLKVIHPTITLENDLIASFDSVKKVLSWFDLLFLEESYMRWIVYFMTLIGHADKTVSEEICRRLELAPRYGVVFCKERFAADRNLLWLERNLPVKNNILYQRLSKFRTELILYMMAKTHNERVKRSISHYFTNLRYVKSSIRGKDLLKMGIPPGPIYRRILQGVLDARLNGEVKSERDELTFVENYIK